jgi:hypothetical protein
VFSLTAWLLSTNATSQIDFLKKLESYSLPLGEKEHKQIIVPNSNSSIAGVVQGKLIPIQSL